MPVGRGTQDRISVKWVAGVGVAREGGREEGARAVMIEG